MRKFLVLTLAVLMLLSLFSCEPYSEDTDPTEDDTSVTDTPETDPSETDPSETDPSETDVPETKPVLEFTEVNETVYVYATNTLYVRKDASAESEPVGEMKEGDQVTRIGYNENWSKISYSGKVCYASSDYLTTHAPLKFSDKTEKVYIIVEGTVNLRQKPSTNADITACLPYGTELERTGVATEKDEFGTEWSRVLYDGQVCYVNSKLIDTEAPATGENFTVIDNETVYVINVNLINLREFPSLNSSIVKSITVNTQLVRIGIAKEADEEEIVWSKVIYDGITCYIGSSYLTTTPPAAEETKADESQAE